MNLKNMGIFQRCQEWEFPGLVQRMIKEFRRMPFIWEYQRPLTIKRHRVPITLRRKGWVHWNIIQECWHTGNSQISLPLLFETEPIWILSKSYSFKNVIHSIHWLQLPLFPLRTLPCFIYILHTHPTHTYTHTHLQIRIIHSYIMLFFLCG